MKARSCIGPTRHLAATESDTSLPRIDSGTGEEGQVFTFAGRGKLLDLLNSPSSSRRLNICRLAIGTIEGARKGGGGLFLTRDAGLR